MIWAPGKMVIQKWALLHPIYLPLNYWGDLLTLKFVLQNLWAKCRGFWNKKKTGCRSKRTGKYYKRISQYEWCRKTKNYSTDFIGSNWAKEDYGWKVCILRWIAKIKMQTQIDRDTDFNISLIYLGNTMNMFNTLYFDLFDTKSNLH